MSNPVYLVEVEDSEGNTFEVDLNNSEDLDYLTMLRPLIGDKCKIIHLQVDDYEGDDKEWLDKAKTALKHSENHMRYLDRRIKHLKDPYGEIALWNRELDKWHSNNRQELLDIKAFLSASYPEALEDWDILMEARDE